MQRAPLDVGPPQHLLALAPQGRLAEPGLRSRARSPPAITVASPPTCDPVGLRRPTVGGETYASGGGRLSGKYRSASARCRRPRFACRSGRVLERRGRKAAARKLQTKAMTEASALVGRPPIRNGLVAEPAGHRVDVGRRQRVHLLDGVRSPGPVRRSGPRFPARICSWTTGGRSARNVWRITGQFRSSSQRSCSSTK